MEENMKEERLKVLEMLEKGIITVEDSINLLGALKYSAFKRHHNVRVSEEKFNRFSQGVESIARDLSYKAKEIEPRLKEATKVIVQKTADMFEDVSKTLNEKLNNDEQYNFSDKTADESPQNVSDVSEDDFIKDKE